MARYSHSISVALIQFAPGVIICLDFPYIIYLFFEPDLSYYPKTRIGPKIMTRPLRTRYRVISIMLNFSSSNWKSRSPEVQWYAIQTMLEETQSDVLILLDYCAASSSIVEPGSGNYEICSGLWFGDLSS